MYVTDISQYCVLVQLTAGLDVLADRVAQRSSHFMPSSLLTSQLAVLEPLGPAEGTCLMCQTTATVDSVVGNIQHFLLSLMDS